MFVALYVTKGFSSGCWRDVIEIVDIFSYTIHVETVALLSNTPGKKESYITLDVEMEDYYRIMSEECEK